MNQILSLRLSEREHINVVSQTANLETIVCCDLVSLVFEIGDKKVVIQDSLPVKDLEGLKKGLEKIMNKQQHVFTFLEEECDDFDECDESFSCCTQSESEYDEDSEDNAMALALYVDQCDNFSIEIGSLLQLFFKKTVEVEALKSWVAQLELLHVLTEENEKEQQSRGKGCC